MIGVGTVYSWYRDGIIESDDEVAVTTNPETFEAVSVPLVNISQTFSNALDDGMINKEEHDALLNIAIGTHYTLRSYLGIIKEALQKGILNDGSALLTYCREHEADVKKEDALMVLEKIKELL